MLPSNRIDGSQAIIVGTGPLTRRVAAVSAGYRGINKDGLAGNAVARGVIQPSLLHLPSTTVNPVPGRDSLLLQCYQTSGLLVVAGSEVPDVVMPASASWPPLTQLGMLTPRI